MKYLIVLALVLVVVGLWQSRRRSDSRDADNKANANKPKPLPPATEIVACDVCHIHLPRSEALSGPGGIYCSAAHRKQAGA